MRTSGFHHLQLKIKLTTLVGGAELDVLALAPFFGGSLLFVLGVVMLYS